MEKWERPVLRCYQSIILHRMGPPPPPRLFSRWSGICLFLAADPSGTAGTCCALAVFLKNYFFYLFAFFNPKVIKDKKWVYGCNWVQKPEQKQLFCSSFKTNSDVYKTPDLQSIRIWPQWASFLVEINGYSLRNVPFFCFVEIKIII